MKRTFGSILAVFLMAGGGIAQQSRPASRPAPADLELVRHFEQWSRHHPEAAAKLKARMDQNGDGRVDANEKELALQILRERREEFRTWVREHPEKPKERVASQPAPDDKPVPVPGKADQNRDGTVDAKERDRARQIQRAKERMEKQRLERKNGGK
jgi:hypothetical protein